MYKLLQTAINLVYIYMYSKFLPHSKHTIYYKTTSNMGINVNNEARSRYYCCSGKAISIT